MDKFTVLQILAIPTGYAACWVLVATGLDSNAALDTIIWGSLCFILICEVAKRTSNNSDDSDNDVSGDI
jgi:hypothetical protein